jgi:peptide-methionine (S)-S-oxide reductase
VVLAAPASPNFVQGQKAQAGKEVATLAAGCFWSMEAIFKQLKGVEKVEPGYAGGKLVKPSYEQVEEGNTGHAESLNVIFDPKVITFRDLLEVLLTVRDPTTKDRQGNDEGPQYRFIIFYRSEEQHKAADEMIKKFTAAKVWPRPIVAEVKPYINFYRAEDYHFDYYRLHPNQPYCKNVIAPEIAEFRAKFKSKLKKP